MTETPTLRAFVFDDAETEAASKEAAKALLAAARKIGTGGFDGRDVKPGLIDRTEISVAIQTLLGLIVTEHRIGPADILDGVAHGLGAFLANMPDTAALVFIEDIVGGALTYRDRARGVIAKAAADRGVTQ